MCAPRPSTAPSFLLSRKHGSLHTRGCRASFSEVDAAIHALRSDDATMVVGALPFLRSEPAALTVPERVTRVDGPLELPRRYQAAEPEELAATVVALDPQHDEHVARIDAAVAAMSATELRKVVLARAVDIAFEQPVDPLVIAARLIELSSHRDGFVADLSPAGPRYRGHWLVGSSPEVLIRRRGRVVTAFPLAGSAPRSADPAEDRANAERLERSTKDRYEHSFVVEHLRSRLEGVCAELDIPEEPQLTSTAEMWHLATPIRGMLRDDATSALELARLVHPTPAICGTPTDAAEAFITEAEAPRGFYAGAVGWCDGSGDGEYMVAIRCAEVASDRARAWAGGGIVTSSDPEAEYEETTAKLGTVLRTLGLRDPLARRQ